MSRPEGTPFRRLSPRECPFVGEATHPAAAAGLSCRAAHPIVPRPVGS